MSTLGLPEIVADVSKDTGFAQHAVRKIIQSFLTHIEDCMTYADKVQIKGFGGFHCSNMPERYGRNVKDGEPIVIPPMKRMRFRPSRVLLERIQDKPGDAPNVPKIDTHQTNS